MVSHASRAENYRNKAEEIRVIAESMTNMETRRLMLNMADDYLHMAATLDRITAEKTRGH